MKKNIFWSLLFCLLIGSELLAVQAVIRLNMLPVAYLIAVGAVLAGLTVAVGCLLFCGRRHRGKG